MRYIFKISLAILVILFLGSCSSSRKTTYGKPRKKKKEIVIETTRLGKNKMFFSKEYQRKLQKRMKKKKNL